MKKSKLTDVQIVFALQQAENGVAVVEVCRKLGIIDAISTTGRRSTVDVAPREYNAFRPHSAWSDLTPNEVVQQQSNGPIFPIFRLVVNLGRVQTFNSYSLLKLAGVRRKQGGKCLKKCYSQSFSGSCYLTSF